MEGRELTAKLYTDIKAEFEKLQAVKEFGVQKFSIEWIFRKLGEKFYKAPKTIENIVFSRTQYQNLK